MKTDDVVQRLAGEYISKIKSCDECFAEHYCILNGLRESRNPCADAEKCEQICIMYLRALKV